MKKEVSPAVIAGVLIAVVVGICVAVYLQVRPQKVQTRKGVPWEGRAGAGAGNQPPGPGGTRQYGGPPPGP